MGSLFGGSSGSTGSQQQTQSQNQSTRYSPEYEAYTNDILKRATAAADTPWQGYDVNKMFAGFTGDQEQAFNQIRGYQGAYQGYFDQGKGALDRAGQLDPLKAAQPYLDAAGNSIRPWDAGAGAIAGSGKSWVDPGVRDAYMGDYQEGAINRAADISNRNFMEKTMPGITSQFAKGTGALGRGNYARFTGDAVRDLAGEQAGTAATMMDKGYFNAANIFGADQSRLQQAGVNLGNLANQNMGALTNLGKTQSDITTGAVNTGIGLSNAYAQQAGALSNINLMNTNALLQAGNQQQQQNQLPLTAQYQQWQQQQKWPFEMVNFLNSAQRGLNFPTTQSGSSTTQSGSTSGSSNQPSTAGSVLGVLSSANSLFGKGNEGGISRGIGALGDIFGSGTSTSTLPNNETYNFPQPEGNPQWRRGGRVPEYARGGAVRRYAQGGQAFGPIVEPRGVLRSRRENKYAVGGDVPVQRGMQGRPPMGPPGGLGALPPPPAMGGGPFSAQGGMALPPMPQPPAMPGGIGPGGPLSAMR